MKRGKSIEYYCAGCGHQIQLPEEGYANLLMNDGTNPLFFHKDPRFKEESESALYGKCELKYKEDHPEFNSQECRESGAAGPSYKVNPSQLKRLEDYHERITSY